LTVPAIVCVRLLSNMANEWWAPTVVAKHTNAAVKQLISGKRFMVEVLVCAQDPYDGNAGVLTQLTPTSGNELFYFLKVSVAC
jgi:hypothetical protein